MFKLGSKLKSRVTGFEGIATARLEFLNGCVRYCITPKMKKDGKMPEGEYVDVEELVLLKQGGVQLKAEPSGGGPNPSPHNRL